MPRSVFRHGLASVLVLGAMLVAPDVADAAAGSRICRQIEAQLSGGGGSSQSRKFSAAAQRQRGEIAKVRRQLRAAGCGFFSSGGSCRSLIGRGSAHGAQPLRAAARSGPAVQRRCRADHAGSCLQRWRPTTAAPCAAWRPRRANRACSSGFLSARAVNPAVRNTRPRIIRSAKFRTWWVATGQMSAVEKTPNRTDTRRSTPATILRAIAPSVCALATATISRCRRSSSRSEFARDGQNCQAACPGAETQVYYHRGGQEDAAEMTSSVSGKPYSDMATAFLYRSDAAPSNAACSCSAVRSRKVSPSSPARQSRLQLRWLMSRSLKLPRRCHCRAAGPTLPQTRKRC